MVTTTVAVTMTMTPRTEIHHKILCMHKIIMFHFVSVCSAFVQRHIVVLQTQTHNVNMCECVACSALLWLFTLQLFGTLSQSVSLDAECIQIHIYFLNMAFTCSIIDVCVCACVVSAPPLPHLPLPSPI